MDRQTLQAASLQTPKARLDFLTERFAAARREIPLGVLFFIAPY
jgi:hypothetical protein